MVNIIYYVLIIIFSLGCSALGQVPQSATLKNSLFSRQTRIELRKNMSFSFFYHHHHHHSFSPSRSFSLHPSLGDLLYQSPVFTTCLTHFFFLDTTVSINLWDSPTFLLYYCHCAITKLILVQKQRTMFY